ncbi:MAG TPA: response regulator transcription factor [Acidimicrobiales bacterium]|jgi:DNA-binding NarL/FixJ family response regulator|nr:response regulator transcription factor [Acidimicrobiales bacterium]
MTTSNGSRPIRVVIADDEADVRLLLRIQLEHEGFEIAGEANDGKSAIEQCAETQPDALVLDLLMPGVNGFEAIPTLRRQHPEIAVVAYTAVAGEFVRKEMARLRIPLLLKSGNVSALAEKLRELVRSA